MVITSPCFNDTLAIDTTIFASPAFTYNIKDETKFFSWNDGAVSSLLSQTLCGSYTWDVTQDDETSLDSTIFTVGDFTLTTKTIAIYSAECLKSKTYNMLVKVYYTELPFI